MALVPTEYTSSDTHSDYTTTDTDSVFGGEDDLWGAPSISPEQLADPAFTITFDADVGAGTLRVDQVKVEVFFTTPSVGVQNEPPYPEHQTGIAYVDGDIIWAIADDGTARKYTATGAGSSAATAPVFPRSPGGGVVDGDITWTESGQYRPASLPPYYASTLQAGAIGRDTSGNRVFMVVGQKGVVKTSLDGVTWVERTTGVVDTLRGVTAHTSGFVAVGDNGTIITSPDGVTWQREASGTMEAFFSVDFDRTTQSFTAVGKDGLIRQKAEVAWVAINR